MLNRNVTAPPFMTDKNIPSTTTPLPTPGPTGKVAPCRVEVHLAWILAVGIAALPADTPMPEASSHPEIAVIYHEQLPESRSVAEHYASKRGIPVDHLISLKPPETEAISRRDYQRKIERPLLHELRRRKLMDVTIPEYPPENPTGMPLPVQTTSRIRYLVVCFGIPLKIQEEPGLTEPAVLADLPSRLHKNYAAVDNELAALPLRSLTSARAGPLSNRAFNATNSAALNPTNGVLMVTRLDGPTAEIARGLVDKALQAEANGLWGRAYFDFRGLSDDSEYKIGDQWIQYAAELSRRIGFDIEINPQPGLFDAAYPMSHIALYAGWYEPHVSGPFTLPEINFMAGAFAYHLHSTSAASIRTTNRHWVGPLLARGVTATMGCVYEPYLQFTPNLSIFFNRFLQGFTFGEAAYASLNMLSWQTVIVGDPLYRPFATPPAAMHQHLVESHHPNEAWSHLRFINANLVRGVDPAELVEYIRTNAEVSATLKTSAILQEKLAEILRFLDRPKPAVTAYETALQLNPSPQQAKRLRLRLISAYKDAGESRKALDAYRDFLHHYPNHPNRFEIYQRMLPLAEGLGDTNEVEAIRRKIRNSPIDVP